jgi:hypothetical protein
MVQARPRRRRWIALAIVMLLLGGAALWIRSLLQPERLSAFLLQRATAATGLQLRLETPASVGFWPDLHLELDGLSAHAPGEADPLLRVQRVETALPWSALRSGNVQLKGLRLIAPALDLAAAMRWSASRQVEGPPAPLRLPQFDAPLSVSEGIVRGDGWSVTAFALELPALRDAVATSLTTTGIVERGALRTPFDLRIEATPRQQGDRLTLDALRIALHEPDVQTPWITLTGNATLDLPQRIAFELDGDLPTWPAGWPPLPFAAAADPRVSVALQYHGAMPPSGSFGFSLQRGEDGLRGTLRAGDIAAWLAQAPRIGLPPVLGSVEADALQFGETTLSGVRLRFDADADADIVEGPASTDAKP